MKEIRDGVRSNKISSSESISSQPLVLDIEDFKAAEAQEALEDESLAKVEVEVREELAQTLEGLNMKEIRDGVRSNKISSSESISSQPLVLDIEDFKGDFSFDALFGNLVNELLPAFQEEDADSLEGNGNISGNDALSNGRSTQTQSSPLFPEVDSLLSMFKNSCSQLVELQKQIDGRLYNLKKDVAAQDSKHRKTLGEIDGRLYNLKKDVAAQDSKHRKTLGEINDVELS
ncbi:putative exocyst complex component Sec10 [Helianthus annuus]|uniref:Putative exocyst complex component Sec10-like protein n=1 Tax=Helianthus annuus TaxID=4232 RepID=A0A251SI82_HELAN|nr:exocyst complex component SEC10a [Helianthus annuus]XP_035836168.1 exocyst complex component SEC10a [Helianthus annuus]XP_035836169.1 exocyst complex component SEC10a [Helianthus annuus]KAJ0517560.1 putative exocyst complex component Sec10 [Helianthus annuus]KAJ0638438.1 putative exocyst complex component Sec10 [Helianthus annuus]KAJ0685570.1 putative exocyst complex component Sec10 [Helianthus annuus]KAJ0689463.1 putative exocyst complex component Sec10 [Helianthus annuus]